MSKILIILTIVIGLLKPCFAENIARDIYTNFEIPIYRNAEDVNYFFDPSTRIKSTTYIVGTAYPAKKIVNFYKNKFKEFGFCEIVQDRAAKGKWISFQDGSRKGTPFIRTFAKSWTDQEETVRILLVLRYETEVFGKWRNELLVSCQIIPYIDTEALDKFYDKLHKENEFEHFFEMLNKYTIAEQHVDFKKAIEKNPDNRYLLEYYDIVRKCLGIIPQREYDE